MNMKDFLKKGWKILGHVIAIGLALTLVASCNADAAETVSMLNLDETAPTGFSETMDNPYGTGYNKAFSIVAQDEILYYDHSGEGAFFDIENNDELKTYLLSFSDYNTTGTAFAMPEGDWLHTKAIAFDGNGGGRDRYVFFAGINVFNEVRVWILDSKENTCSEPIYVCSISWTENLKYHEIYDDVLELAAGDFNGDGKDSVVLYAAADHIGYYGDGATLYSFAMDETTESPVMVMDGANGDFLLHDTYKDLENIYFSNDPNHPLTTYQTRLGVSLGVGDFNNDGLDDLSVLSFCHPMDDIYYDESLYIPQLKVSFGSKEFDPADFRMLGTEADAQFRLSSNTSGHPSDANGYAVFPFQSDLAVGDFDGDGYDDIAVAGAAATLKSKQITGAYSTEILYENTHNILFQYYSDRGTLRSLHNGISSAADAPFETSYETAEKDGVYPRSVALAVEVDGPHAKAALFFNGRLYDISQGNWDLLFGNDFFNRKDTTFTVNGKEKEFDKCYISAATVGSFCTDAAEAGREQAAYVMTLRDKDSGAYYSTVNYIRGIYPAITASAVSYGAATDYEDLGENSLFSGNFSQIEAPYSSFLIAADSDEDGFIAKYIGATYAYSDPEVAMVLQAAPYFGDIASASGNWTEYAMETSTSFSDSDSNAVSAGLGGSTELNIPFTGGLELVAGAALDWSEEFTESYDQTFGQSFVAQAYDCVVVKRTPFYIYQFDVLDENGNWYGGPMFQYALPQAPVYESLSVEDYNAFVETYNAMMSGVFGTNGFDRLHTINEEENHLKNNEGNPYAYDITGWNDSSIGETAISNTANALGKNNGLGRVYWTESNSSTEDWSMSSGFDFSFSLSFGPRAWNSGPQGAINYRNGWGTSTTTGTAVGAYCAVADLDGPGLKAQGIPEEVINAYGFNWTFGRWERHLWGDENTTTPFVGYALSDVKSPSLPVTDLRAKALNDTSMELSWSKPKTIDGRPVIDGYQVYKVTESGAYEKLDIAIGADETSTVIEGLEPLTSYSFVITSLSDQAATESLYSNIAAARTKSVCHALSYLAQDDKAATVTAFTEGLVKVESGSDVEEDSIIIINATAKDDNCRVLGIEVKRGEQTWFVDAEEDQKSAKAYFLMTADTQVTVLTDRILKQAIVDYKSQYDHGSVTAATYGFPILPGSHAMVSGPVTFTATPAENYIVTEWQVSANGETTTYPAEGNTFLLELRSEECFVEAVFTEENAILKTITLEQPKEGGSIRVTNINGETLVPIDDKIKVSPGTEVVFCADVLTGYVIKGWTGALADQTDETVTLTVVDDITIGLDLVAPIRYGLEYEVIGDASGGSIITEPAYDSGAYLAAGTKVTMHIRAAQGHEIAKIRIRENGAWSDIDLSGISGKYDREITINSNIRVEAYFAANKLNYETDRGGTITVEGIENGGAIAEGSVVNATVKANDGYRLDSISVTNGDTTTSYDYNEAGKYSAEETLAITANGDVYIKATFKPIILSAKVTTGSNSGSILSDPDINSIAMMPFGTEVQLTAKAKEGYRVEAIRIYHEGSLIPEVITPNTPVAEYPFTIRANHTQIMEVSFVPAQLTYAAMTEGGTVTVDPFFESGGLAMGDVTVTIKADPGYVIDKYIRREGNKSYTYQGNGITEKILTYTIDQNYTFEAYFKPVYLTYAAPNGGGAILAETVSGAPFNGELTATIQADSGHFIHSVIVTENGKETVYDYSGQLLTTTEVKWNITQYDVDIRAYFTPVKVEYEVTEGSGTITTEPALSSGDLHRGELKLQISAAEGYCIGEVIKTTLGESTATDYAAEKLQQLELTENITDDTEFQVTFYPISELNCDIYDSEWGDVFVSVNSGARQKVAGNGVLRTLLKNGASFEIIAYPDDGYVVSDNIAQSDSEAIYGDWKKNRDGSYSLFVDGKAPHLSYKIRFEPCYCSNYATIDHNAWFHDAVRYVLVHKLMQGYSENLFGHADTTTRAQLITILHRMEGSPAAEGEIPFTDIPQDTWYTEAVKWAYINDVTKGTSETTFSPDEPLTREQLVTFLYRYAKDRDYDTSIHSDLNGFADHKTVSGYAQDALKWAIAMGIVQGTDKGEIEPKAHATRAQLAAILHRFHTMK